jgi:CheY-like chemotaxis protein
MDPAAPSGSLKILIVEDCADTADTLGLILGLEGHDVHIAHHSAAAIEVVASRWPDVVLLDLAMPGADGYHVANGIRAQCGDKPKPLFVVISGHATEADRLRSEAEGMYLHFAKPVEASLVIGLLRQFASERRTSPSPVS